MLNREQVEKIREDFSYLKSDKKYIYFDNGATTQNQDK